MVTDKKCCIYNVHTSKGASEITPKAQFCNPKDGELEGNWLLSHGVCLYLTMLWWFGGRTAPKSGVKEIAVILQVGKKTHLF